MSPSVDAPAITALQDHPDESSGRPATRRCIRTWPFPSPAAPPAGHSTPPGGPSPCFRSNPTPTVSWTPSARASLPEIPSPDLLSGWVAPPARAVVCITRGRPPGMTLPVAGPPDSSCPTTVGYVSRVSTRLTTPLADGISPATSPAAATASPRTPPAPPARRPRPAAPCRTAAGRCRPAPGRPAAARARRAARSTSAWRGLSSRIRFTFGGSWPIARYIFSRVGVRSPGSPTRHGRRRRSAGARAGPP